MKEKVCTVCEKELPATKEYFYYDKRDGKLRSRCMECLKKISIDKSEAVKEKNRKLREEKKALERETELKYGRVCRICKGKFPLTLEYFHSNKGYKDGLDTACKKCVNLKDKERRAIREGRNTKETKQETRINLDYQKLVNERNQREEEHYRKLINEKETAGVYIKDVKLKLGQAYKVFKTVNGNRDKYIDHFEGVMVQDNKNNVVLKHKMGYCEAFLKADLLTGEYKIEEVTM